MTLRLGVELRKAEADGAAAKFNGGKFEIYSNAGSQPATPETSPSPSVLLCTITLANPAFTGAADSNGIITLDTPQQANAVAAGVALWGRMKTSTDVALMDGSITEAGGGGQFIIDSTTIAVSDPVRLSSFTYQRPME